MTTQEKYNKLKQGITEKKRMCIAFSAGIDSMLVLKTALDMLGQENVMAVTFTSVMQPSKDAEDAKAFCSSFGIKHIIEHTNELSIEQVRNNTKDRCYYCKYNLFMRLVEIADEYGFDTIADGTNADDLNEYRPGLKALTELNIYSPLALFQLTKTEVREIARKLGLSASNRPSSPCMATRFPYGTVLTPSLIDKVKQGEALLKQSGYPVSRLRCHGDIARIEVPRSDFIKILINDELVQKLRDLGFLYITLDLEGFLSGSMDKAIRK